MDIDTIVGCILLVTVLCIIISLVVWSRRTIIRIAEKDFHSARDIVRGLKDGR